MPGAQRLNVPTFVRLQSLFLVFPYYKDVYLVRVARTCVLDALTFCVARRYMKQSRQQPALMSSEKSLRHAAHFELGAPSIFLEGTGSGPRPDDTSEHPVGGQLAAI